MTSRRKRDAYYDALRDRDYDKLIRAAASTEGLLHYLRLREAHQAAQPPSTSTQLLDAPQDVQPLYTAIEKARKESLEELINDLIFRIVTCSLDFPEMSRCLQWVRAIDLSSSLNAYWKIHQMYEYIGGYK